MRSTRQTLVKVFLAVYPSAVEAVWLPSRSGYAQPFAVLPSAVLCFAGVARSLRLGPQRAFDANSPPPMSHHLPTLARSKDGDSAGFSAATVVLEGLAR